jgi:23S rRNA (pseudouridine1915-N3)-methyltransferase
LNCRSRPSSLKVCLVSLTVRYTVLAVGKVKPPYADDVAHYERLLRKQARVDVIEVADDDAIARRIPERAYVSLLDDRGEAYDSEAFARWLEQRRQAGLDVCFVLGGAYGIELERSDPPALARPDDAPAPARARGAARAALPRPQDPRRGALPSLT